MARPVTMEPQRRSKFNPISPLWGWCLPPRAPRGNPLRGRGSVLGLVEAGYAVLVFFHTSNAGKSDKFLLLVRSRLKALTRALARRASTCVDAHHRPRRRTVGRRPQKRTSPGPGGVRVPWLCENHSREGMPYRKDSRFESASTCPSAASDGHPSHSHSMVAGGLLLTS
jgi:hypothetical protein